MQSSPDVVPAGGRAQPRRSGINRLLRLAGWLLLFSVLQVALLRVVPPAFSMFMASRALQAWTAGQGDFRIAYDWRPLSAIAPVLPVALVAAEDQNFARHHGFDLAAIQKARRANERGRALRGASTISQQVAKNLFLWSGRSWLRKGLETWYTLLIELLWPKRRILEVYANVAEFGDGVYGAQAAARGFFRKDAASLNAAEAAQLAAVLPNPKRYRAVRPTPYVQRRARWIERQSRQLGGASYLRTLERNSKQRQ